MQQLNIRNGTDESFRKIVYIVIATGESTLLFTIPSSQAQSVIL